MDAKGNAKTEWLDELADSAGPLLTLPGAGILQPELTLRSQNGETCHYAARVWDSVTPRTIETPRGSEAFRWFEREPLAPTLQTYRIAPSAASATVRDLPTARVVARTTLGPRIPIQQAPATTWDEVGTTLHRFLAADVPAANKTRRLALASSLLRQANLATSFEPRPLIAMSDALRTFCQERWPGAEWFHELPVSAVVGLAASARRIEGSIDLLLRTPGGVVVIDHKSYPGRSDAWADRAIEYAPQLLVYERALSAAGQIVLGTFIHFSVGGGMVQIAAA
jgi:hypothetical protein